MARAGKKTYYWDSCSWIAWLEDGEKYPSEVVAGLDEIAKEVNQNKAILCSSVVVKTELLQGKLTAEQATRLENLFKRKNVIQVNIDGRVSTKASEIRNYYNQRGIKISTPDAIHLATAILYQVDEFHTLDGSGDRQRPNDLLRLNGDVAGYPLHIRVPKAIQGSLFTPVNPKSE